VIAGAKKGALANHIMIVLIIMHRVVRALCQSLVLAVLYEADVQRSLYTLASHLCDIVLNALAPRRLSTASTAPNCLDGVSSARAACFACLCCLRAYPFSMA
jgi:hypothetical protein